MTEQSHNATDHAEVPSGAENKPRADDRNSSPLEPAYPENESRESHSTHSVPFRLAKKRMSRTKGDEHRSDAMKASDPVSPAQTHTSSRASNSDKYFSRSVAELQRVTTFVIKPDGTCQVPNLYLLYEEFGLRIDVIATYLLDRSFLSPPDDVSYMKNFAQSAQGIIRELSDFSRRPPISLIDFGFQDILAHLIVAYIMRSP